MANHYSGMKIDDICNLPVEKIADKNCILFLWATYPMLKEALRVIESWNFFYKSIAFQWVKLNKKNKKPFYGLGRWCLGENTKIIVCHKETEIIKYLTIKELFIEGFFNYKIFTNNEFKELLDVRCNGIKDVMSIKHSFGETICTPNHRWAIKKMSMPRKKDGTKGRIRKHITTFATCSEIVKMKKLSIYKKNGVNLLFSPTKITSPNPITTFENIVLNFDIGWLIGLYCAEGYISGKYKRHIKFCLHSKENLIFNKIKEIIDNLDLRKDRYFNYKVEVHKFIAKDKKAMYVYFTSQKIANLIKYFIKGISANTKDLYLDIILKTSVEFREGFIKGYLDGDGTKVSNKYKCGKGWNGFNCVTTASEKLSKSISKVLYSVGVMHIIDKLIHQPSKIVKTIREYYKIRFLTPINDKIIFQDNKVYPVRIKSIKKCDPITTYDLTVEGEVFWADGLISHNTRGNTEPCLLATKGKPKRISASVFQLIQEPLTRHSAKPPIVRDKIVELMGDLPRIELFARKEYTLFEDPTMAGWDLVGNGISGNDMREDLNRIIN